MASPQPTPFTLPRVAITFCTKCHWMLRATYFAQELFSTFSNQIGEIALIPATGGLFTVELTYKPKPEAQSEGEDVEIKNVLLWDRKTQGGFPETKVLKQLVRDHIDPSKDLGHSDRGGKKKKEEDNELTKEKEQEEAQGEEDQASENAKPEQKTQGESTEIPIRGPVMRNTEGQICEDCT